MSDHPASKVHAPGSGRPMRCGQRYGVVADDPAEVTCTNCLRMMRRVVLGNSGHAYDVTDRQRALVEYVRLNAEATYRAVADAVGLSHSTVLRDARTLRALGILRATTDGLGRYAKTTWAVARDVITRPVSFDLGSLVKAMASALGVNGASTERGRISRENQRGIPETVAAPLTTPDHRSAEWRALGVMLRARMDG